ncbi:unnamed protein product [Parascedosporium putredinis]|uniref:Uncharacterized protein n=1 Tax=Parascedosporium putredinis TaxID=1442378 RepID=A0A9P1GU69_9PEZI|nr:unnamed protein product [Parascedosporium putredinis]CAI7987467.1 unnamed protein product [Parascedosporium putredinis]
MSMHRNKSSAGFSLDIPLIMLVASFLKISYWPSARFEGSLLAQAILMVFVQVVLLKIALDHRPPPSSRGGDAAIPFAGAVEPRWAQPWTRPYNFWQWRSPKPYWNFLLYLSVTLFVCEFLLSPFSSVYTGYATLLGYLGLAIEATLPIPQILANASRHDPLAFKMCGIFQACCDAFLGVQYLMYGEEKPEVVKDHVIMEDMPGLPDSLGGSRLAKVSSTENWEK